MWLTLGLAVRKVSKRCISEYNWEGEYYPLIT